MRFGAGDDFVGLTFDDLFTDRQEQQKHWRQLLEAKAGKPLPVQFYYGVSGEGKSYLRRQVKKLAADMAGIPTLVLDLEGMGLGKEGPDRAALILRLVSEIQMPAPRVQLAALFIAMEEAKSLVDGRALAEDLAVNAVSAGADAFMQSLQGKFESISIGSFLGAFAKAGWQTYQKSKQPLQAYLKTEEGQADLQRLRRAETPEEIKRTMFKRFGRDLQFHEQHLTGNRAAKAVLLVDTLEADSSGSKLDSEAKTHTWIGDLYAACNEAKDGSSPRLLIAAFGRSKVIHGIPENHCEERMLGGIPEEDAKDYLINRRKVPAELVPAMIDEAKIGNDPFCHAFSLGLLGDSYALENDLPAVEEGWQHLPKEEALAQRFLKQISQGETGDDNYLARLALTPVWDEEAAKFAFNVHMDAEKGNAKHLWLQGFSFVQPATFPQTDVPGFTLHSIMRKALTETSREEDTKRRHSEWEDYWQARSASFLDAYNRAAWWHRFYLDPNRAMTDWAALAQAARRAIMMKDHLVLVQMAGSWLSDEPPETDETARQTWAGWKVAWGYEAPNATLGDTNVLAMQSVDSYRGALEVYTEETLPYKWAATQNKLGIALANLGDRSGSDERLLESLSAYRKSMKVYTKEAFPDQWMAIQNNIGNVLRTFGERSGSEEKLLESAYAFRNALEVWTEETDPTQRMRATLQNNLGTVLQSLGERSDSDEKLLEAFIAYSSALEVCTKVSDAAHWAMIQNNLGNVLLVLGERSGSDEMLLESFFAYSSALEVRTKDSLPAQWAMSQRGLADALRALAQLRKDGSMSMEALKAATESLDWFSKSPFTTYVWTVKRVRNASLKLCRDLGAYLSPEMLELLKSIEAEENA